jgi:asparagine synthetase B (glutamine-hydrolysing)
VQKQFYVKSLYIHVDTHNYGSYMKHIWKIKCPPKIKVFTWFLENNLLLTKYNLTKKSGWVIPAAVFCDQAQSSDHLFLAVLSAKLFEGWWPIASMWRSFLGILINAGGG